MGAVFPSLPSERVRNIRRDNPDAGVRAEASAELVRRGEEQPEGRRKGRSGDLAIQSALGGAGGRRRTLLLGGGDGFN